MWLFFAVFSLLAFAAGDLLGKKKVDAGSAAAPLEMLLSVLVLAFGISLVLFASGLGESGEPPWRILREHPPILGNQFCFLLYWVLYLISLRYIGLAVESAVSGTTGILYFSGLLVIHTVSGRLASVHEILHPARLIPIMLVLTFIFLLPNIELFASRRRGALRKKMRQERHRIITGLLILLAGLVFDAGDTLITTLIFDDGGIGIVDYVMANHFATILPIFLLALFLRKIEKKWFIPFLDGGKYSIWYPCVANSSSLLYLCASSRDAVKTGILFAAAPIFPIIGARIILKEKYTWRQNLCIWTIALSLIVFCAADHIL